MAAADLEAPREAGQPRTSPDAAFLGRYESRMRLPIIVSALLPLIIAPESNDWVGILVGVGTWLVFLLDYVVHVRHIVRYTRTRLGTFDLVVVVLTAPWFLIPGAQAGGFVVLLRLARIVRIVMVTRGSRRLFARLGRVVAVALAILVLATAVAYHAEHATNPEFATYGDSLWWGIVTLTTVGYGDVVPKTPTGRWAAVSIMITGIAVLGVLSGSLASFFRLDRTDGGSPEAAAPPVEEEEAPAAEEGTTATAEAPHGTAAAAAATMETLLAEVSALRRQVDVLSDRLGAGAPGSPGSSRGPEGGP